MSGTTATDAVHAAVGLPRAPFVLMELCWIVALLAWLEALGAASGPQPLPVIALLYPAGLVTARRVYGRGLRMWVVIAIAASTMGAGLSALAVLVAPAALDPALWRATPWLDLVDAPELRRLGSLVLAGTACWWRGWMLARRALDLAGFAAGFQQGLIVLLVLVALAAAAPLDAGVPPAAIFGFVTIGLFGLWHARMRGRSGGAPSATRRPQAVLLGIAAVLALGLAVAALVDRALLEALLVPIHWLGERIAVFFAWLAGLLPAPDTTMDLPPMGAPAPAPPPPAQPALRISDWVTRIAEIVFGAVVIGLIAVLLFDNLRSLLRWLRQRDRHTIGVVHGRSEAGFAAALSALRAWLSARLRGAWLALRERIDRVLRPRRTGVAVLYRRLLRRLADRGRERAPQETPEAYRRRLLPEWPGETDSLTTLTNSFVTWRYGGRPADPAITWPAWKRLRKTLRWMAHRDER